MHELSIVFHMINTLEQVAGTHGLATISRVTLDLGEVSGVLPDYLLDCWRWAADRCDLLRGAELNIQTLPATTVCNDCGNTYPTVAHGKTCPHCASTNTVLLRGNEVEIATIEVPQVE